MVALMMTLLLFSYRLADLNPTHGRYGLSVQAASTCSWDEKQVAQLVKAWGWSRPAVLAFVDQLQKYEILEVCNMVTSEVDKKTSVPKRIKMLLEKRKIWD